MDQELKKAVILLKSLIFHYHGLDEDERELLQKTAKKMGAEKELEWASHFIAMDYLSAFERSKDYFGKTINRLDQATKLKLLYEVWEDNHQKGYVTEMETTGMINLAKDWKIEKEFMLKINH